MVKNDLPARGPRPNKLHLPSVSERRVWRVSRRCAAWIYPNSWMVYFMENPIYKWMMKWGTLW